jgi:hypothetical protein
LNCSIPTLAGIPGWDPEERPGFGVKVVGHLDKNSQESSYRRIRDDAEVFLNGRSMGLLGLNPYGLSLGIDSIEIIQDGPRLVVNTCSISTPVGTGGDDRSCEERIAGDVR